ncbi:MAG TPA: PIG-L family deacetylase [Chloroflexota bacterium]|nr:PIG-L family deacetylase [Chloroflexota bacterium]
MRRHIVISPHLDDAVLSLGGTIFQLAASGDEILVVTAFAGAAGPPYSELARELHVRWGSPFDVNRLRRAEDVAALTRLGAEARHLDIRDAIYRRAASGTWMYDAGHVGERGEGTLSGPIHPEDGWIPERLVQSVAALASGPTRIYAPLGIGRHVDHVLAFAAGRLLSREHDVTYYEDYPYVEVADDFGGRPAELPGWRDVLSGLSLEAFRAKVDAFGYYRSQVESVFGGDGYDARMEAWARQLGGRDREFAERLWIPPA